MEIFTRDYVHVTWERKKNIFYVPQWTTQTDKWTTIFYCLDVNLSGKLKFFIKFMGLKRKSSSFCWRCCMCNKKMFNCCRWWSIECSTCLKRFLIFISRFCWIKKNRIFIFPKWCQHSFYLFTYLLSYSCMFSTTLFLHSSSF